MSHERASTGRKVSKVMIMAIACAWLSGGSYAGDEVSFEALAGQYAVVSVRRSGRVAAALDLAPGAFNEIIGQSVKIDATGLWMEGIGCDEWMLTEVTETVDIALDPILADLRLPPLPSDVSQGDRRSGRVFDVACEGEQFTTLFQADSRVMAMSWANSSAYLILEKPLDETRETMVADRLVDMKFITTQNAPPTRADLLAGLRNYFAYRAEDQDAAVPLRPAITENLLDGIGSFSN